MFDPVNNLALIITRQLSTQLNDQFKYQLDTQLSSHLRELSHQLYARLDPPILTPIRNHLYAPPLK
jgi:hypothetical protein